MRYGAPFPFDAGNASGRLIFDATDEGAYMISTQRPIVVAQAFAQMVQRFFVSSLTTSSWNHWTGKGRGRGHTSESVPAL